MADTPILNYKGKYDGPEIDKAVELALGLENPKSCPYYVHVSLSQPDYVLTIGLRDAEGNPFNQAEIDLPLESMVVNATYENGNIILHLQDGTNTEPIPISALIAGLVSETRTIAGIDLKDNITQKELRDALDVYTKDSVDQLVSDLENTINETLNEMKQSLDDLSDLTSEHDTQIKKNTSDIAVNRTTLGTRSKNLLSVNDGTATRIIDKIINQIEPGKYILSIGELTSTDADSSICLCLFTDSYNTSLSNNIHLKRGTDVSATVTINKPAAKIRIYASNDWNNGDGDTVTASNIMLRPADVTDSTYEPYKPSVNERLVEVEENKLNLNFGYAYSGYGGNTGWKRLAHCEFTPTSTGIIRDTTLYIEKMPGTERGWSESSECEGILKFRVLGNKNSNGTYSMGSLFINALLNKELPSDEIALIGKVEGSVLIAEIWCKITALYSGYRAAMISNTNRTNGVNPNTQTHWILDSSGTNVSAVDSYPAWTYTTTKIIDYYGDIIKGLSDRITALENK